MVLISGNFFSKRNNFKNYVYVKLIMVFMKDILILDLLKDGVGDSGLWS